MSRMKYSTPGVLKLRPTGRIWPPRVLNPAPRIYGTPTPPPLPGVGGGNQAAVDDFLPSNPHTGPLFKKFEDPVLHNTFD